MPRVTTPSSEGTAHMGHRLGKSHRFELQRFSLLRLRLAAYQMVKAFSIQGLNSQQFRGYRLQLIVVLFQYFLGLAVSRIENFFYLGINSFGRPFAAIPLEGAVSAWNVHWILALGAVSQ